MKIFKNIKGETLTETIIAMTIFAVGITLSSTLVASSLRNINTSKNRVIAVNLAREGIEAVRNMRDTNWLKYSSKRRTCWNQMPTSDPTEACDGANPIEPGRYIVYKSEDQRWRLQQINEADTFDETLLYTVDIDTTYDTDGDGDMTNDADIYNHRISDINDDPTNDAIGRKNATLTTFHRIITIDYLDNDGTPLGEGNPVTDEYNRMEVTADINWTRGGATHSTQLKTHLTDYLGRDNLEN
jgi:hypothetical protein